MMAILIKTSSSYGQALQSLIALSEFLGDSTHAYRSHSLVSLLESVCLKNTQS
jgi:hypothetical protein